MGFDLFQSRRNFNERCNWWSVKVAELNDDVEDNELVYNRIPTGTFMAKEVGVIGEKDNVVNGLVMMEKNTVTIVSPDDLTGIKSRDYVEYQGEYWLVDDVQVKKARLQNTEFASLKGISKFWYLSLRK